MTLVERSTLSVVANVSLADSPANTDPKKSQGRPYGFEGLAWTPDGSELWLPHMLYSGSHPIQFQSTVFPAVSVVDVAELREVTNQGAAKNKFPGRKELFEAINVLDATANTEVVSQPCAAAVHPEGLRAYVLACGSEDLVVFDVPSGRAVELLHGLPGDHPAGIVLEPSGERAFVTYDQSHTLSVVDLGGGDVLSHPKLVGEPIPLVDVDPLEPATRRGRTLFFRANAEKGTLAASGDSWMSCAACHLDGFVSTNLFLLEASTPDLATDALFGHHGLTDLFSTAPRPAAASFDPHDVLVAFTDQGGLAPDRRGEDRTGAEDPAAPSDEARQMAADVATVIAQDLPFGPSWQLPGDLPAVEYDGEWCGSCHAKEWEEWRRSAHAHAARDPFVEFVAKGELALRGKSYLRLCQGCHDPLGARSGTPSLSDGAGVTCTSCHDTSRLIAAGGNADLEARGRDWTRDHAGQGELERLRGPEFCGGCHQQFVPGRGLRSIDTLTEWQASGYAGAPEDGGRPCVACHMPRDADGHASHAVVGGNVALAVHYPVAGWEAAIRANLAEAAELDAEWKDGAVAVTVHNVGAGHSLPTGVADLREMWIELEARDASGKLLEAVGGPGSDGLVPETAARFGFDIATSDGTPLFLHELSLATRIPFDRRVPAGGAVTLNVDPGPLAAGAASVEAVLRYRNLRPTFYRAALGDAAAEPPVIELARAAVSGTR